LALSGNIIRGKEVFNYGLANVFLNEQDFKTLSETTDKTVISDLLKSSLAVESVENEELISKLFNRHHSLVDLLYELNMRKEQSEFYRKLWKKMSSNSLLSMVLVDEQ